MNDLIKNIGKNKRMDASVSARLQLLSIDKIKFKYFKILEIIHEPSLEGFLRGCMRYNSSLHHEIMLRQRQACNYAGLFKERAAQ